MSIAMILLLFGTGLLSGIVNAIAGGGTFLTFGVMTLAGLPPIVANATSALIQIPGYATSAFAYRSEIVRHGCTVLTVGAICAAGGLAGALLLLSLSNVAFRAVVPWLLLAATAIFAAGPLLRPEASPEQAKTGPAGVAGQFLTAIYGGFFGAGLGIMALAVLGLTLGGGYHRLNALKNVISFVVAAVAITVFASGGVIDWLYAAIMVPGAALGGYLGVWMARRASQGLIRALVVVAGSLLTVYYFVSG